MPDANAPVFSTCAPVNSMSAEERAEERAEDRAEDSTEDRAEERAEERAEDRAEEQPVDQKNSRFVAFSLPVLDENGACIITCDSNDGAPFYKYFRESPARI
jgi:hypothetical protein